MCRTDREEDVMIVIEVTATGHGLCVISSSARRSSLWTTRATRKGKRKPTALQASTYAGRGGGGKRTSF